jgi:hypothetical protein
MSCQSHRALQLYQARLGVYIPPLKSYSADYALMPLPLDSLAKLALSDQYVDIEGVDKWNNPTSTRYQNPLLPVDCSQDYAFKVVGEVERVSYEPAQDIEDRILSYAFGGLIGLALSSEEGSMAAYTQYRFWINDSRGHTIDSLLVIGVSAGDPRSKSRKELVSEANYFACSEFAAQLVMSISKNTKLNLDHLSPVFSDPAQRISKHRKYFEARLKSGAGSSIRQ